MCLDSFLSARSIHDVARMNYVRSRDAQKQLARTPLSEIVHVVKAVAIVTSVNVNLSMFQSLFEC